MRYMPIPGMPPEPILILEAFGTLSEGTGLPVIDTEEEDLYSVFRERAELMGWLNAPTGSGLRHNRLWSMHEAELIAGVGDSRIGWIQVGLEISVEPALAMPALVQCFHDSLARFGVAELTSLQIKACSLQPSAKSYMWFFIDVFNWFNVISKERVNASVTFDAGEVEVPSISEIVSDLRYKIRSQFEFSETASSSEISVTMSEWTPSAIGYVTGRIIDVIRAREPDVRNFTMRITRTNP